ncbi:hypothetical protein [Actinokineospora sp. HUAS TT18]|uniref:hypothetical protein n=1 Tax=Actinokineospora sp. HUAS TT18 TaxID=3447451 RepID=UPI003F51F974
MEEQIPDMTPPMTSEGNKQVVFAPRIDSGLREQVEGIRGITGQTVNEVGQQALRNWVDHKLADEEVRGQAMAGIEEEERRLKERKAAIAKVLGPTATKTDEAVVTESQPEESTTTATKSSGSTGNRGGRGK